MEERESAGERERGKEGAWMRGEGGFNRGGSVEKDAGIEGRSGLEEVDEVLTGGP